MNVRPSPPSPHPVREALTVASVIAFEPLEKLTVIRSYLPKPRRVIRALR
ncbi:MAG: hypothetical protein QOF33_766 [Thermomicrobiales bacterium]|nr:hypothetical protein [Thermomicrobiales bacterium]